MGAEREGKVEAVGAGVLGLHDGEIVAVAVAGVDDVGVWERGDAGNREAEEGCLDAAAGGEEGTRKGGEDEERLGKVHVGGDTFDSVRYGQTSVG